MRSFPIREDDYTLYVACLGCHRGHGVKADGCKDTFLHGDLHEDLYMEQPAGFVVHASRKLVCRLRKTLYGLKQSPREWYHNFDVFMRSEGYVHSHEDPCLYTGKAADGSLIVLFLYVDDMLIAGKSVADVDALKYRLPQ
ncbi:hypothetical protein L7F22_047848 [Adiantum nelumboides]|nr:hypothetical protein [Adiantum nelumboides]